MGVLHLHLVLGSGTPQHQPATDAFLRLLHELAPGSGFGFTKASPEVMSGEAAARYCGKDLNETISHADAPAKTFYVARRLTQVTKVTMRSRRLGRYEYATRASR